MQCNAFANFQWLRSALFEVFARLLLTVESNWGPTENFSNSSHQEMDQGYYDFCSHKSKYKFDKIFGFPVACLLDDFGLFVHCVQDVSLVPLLVERKGNLWIKESNSFVSKRNLGIKDGFPSKSSNLATLYGFVLWILAPPTPTPPTSDFSLSDNNAKLGSVYPLTSSKGKCVHYLGKQVLITRRQGRRFNGLTHLVGCNYCKEIWVQALSNENSIILQCAMLFLALTVLAQWK